MGRLASAICVIALLFAATTALAASDNVVTATGKITSVNQENRKIGFSGIGKAGKIQTPDGATLIMPGGYKVTLTGFVTKDAAIKSAGNVATLKDIKVGDTVTIRYFETKNAVQIKEITKK